MKYIEVTQKKSGKQICINIAHIIFFAPNPDGGCKILCTPGAGNSDNVYATEDYKQILDKIKNHENN